MNSSRMVIQLWVALVVWLGFAQAQDFSGTFITQGQNGPITLSLQHSGNQVRGTISGNGARFTLEGQVNGDEALGLLRDGQGAMYFLLYFEGDQLILQLAEIDPATRNPVPGTERAIPFTRAQGAPPSAPSPQTGPSNPNPPVSQPDWAGRYSGQNVALELTGAGGRYQGSITVSGARYAVNAQAQGDRLNGTFQAGGRTYMFELRRLGNGFNLLLNGQNYVLQRQGGGAANPPANPPANAPAQPAGSPNFQVEVREGAQYAAGARLGSRAHGVAFSVPQGFRGQTAGSLTVLGDGQGIALLIIPVYGAEMADLVSVLSSPLELSEQAVLEAQGQPTVQGNRATVRYAGQLGNVQAVAVGMATLNQGSGLIVQALTDSAQQARMNQVIQNFMASVGFFAPTSANQLRQVAGYFAGKQVGTFSYSQVSGASSQSTLDLCSNGAYAYQGSAERPWQTAYRTSGGSFTLNPADSAPGGSMGILPGSYSANQHQGRWRVVLFGAEWLLVLMAQDGQLYTRVLSNLDKRFPFFDGKEVASFGASNRCR